MDGATEGPCPPEQHLVPLRSRAHEATSGAPSESTRQANPQARDHEFRGAPPPQKKKKNNSQISEVQSFGGQGKPPPAQKTPGQLSPPSPGSSPHPRARKTLRVPAPVTPSARGFPRSLRTQARGLGEVRTSAKPTRDGKKYRKNHNQPTNQPTSQTDRQTDRQGGQADRQAGRQAGRKADV